MKLLTTCIFLITSLVMMNSSFAQEVSILDFHLNKQEHQQNLALLYEASIILVIIFVIVFFIIKVFSRSNKSLAREIAIAVVQEMQKNDPKKPKGK